MFAETSDKAAHILAGRPKKEAPALIQLSVKIDEDIERELEAIALQYDRPKGYIARNLMLRGLNLFKKDGLLRDLELTPVQVIGAREEKPEGAQAAPPAPTKPGRGRRRAPIPTGRAKSYEEDMRDANKKPDDGKERKRG